MMVILTLLADLVAAFMYYLQAKAMSGSLFNIGVIVEALIVILLVIFVFGYQGKRKSNLRFEGYRHFTLRYGFVFVSFVFNGLLLFLYILNLTGNGVVFGR